MEERKKQLQSNALSLKEEGEDALLAQEIHSIQEVFKVLIKALKNLKIYLGNNPVHQRFLKEFYSKLTHHLGQFGDTILSVGQYTLTCHDQIIYENINRLDSLAFKLFVDGVRQMTFIEGISEEESANLLEVLGKSDDAERPDDDLVTYLWEKKFHHIKFQIIEDYFSENAQIEQISEPDAKAGLDSMVRAELTGQKGADGESGTGQGLSAVERERETVRFHQVFRLTEDEILSIKNEMKLESEKDLISELSGIVYAILQVEKEEPVFAEIAGLMIENAALMIESGDLIQTEKIARLFVTLKEQIPPLPESKIAILDGAINSLGKAEKLGKLEAHLNSLNDKNVQALGEFLRILNVSAVHPIIDILSKAKVRKTRKLLSDILVEIGRKDPTPILSRLQGSPWYVIRNLVQILGEIGSPQSVESLRKLVHYPDERVRKELAYSLSLIGKESDKAREMLLQFLSDHDLGIRKQVIQICQTNRYEKALPILRKMTVEEDFGRRDLEERHLIYGALGKLGGADLLPMLKDQIQPTFFSFFKRSQKEEAAICALYALRHMEIPEAVRLLNDARKHPYRLVAEFAGKAIYELQKVKEKKELNERNEGKNRGSAS